ncbi:hypothetical protein GOP47_0021263 [Adiantum capillus-veneris]|uniref:EF-hand domain-containing protein n=1 Tax=Adiantum capillus-veneris TaxID=13818 RepID=A0A9D4UBR4_ADICA|nr:hypothetical protein GOP47_0021263 [Adiantum capillus-veneris]
MDPSIDDLWYYDLHTSSPPPSHEAVTASVPLLPSLQEEGSPKMQQLRKVFDAMDSDHDGELSGSELCVWMKKLGLTFTEEGMLRMVNHRDVRGCRRLDFKEFVDLNRDIEAEEDVVSTPDAKEAAHQKLLFEVFKVFDRDHDGLISPKELSLTLEELGFIKKKREDSEYVNMIKHMDLDGDGCVSFSDFQSMMDHQQE